MVGHHVYELMAAPRVRLAGLPLPDKPSSPPPRAKASSAGRLGNIGCHPASSTGWEGFDRRRPLGSRCKPPTPSPQRKPLFERPDDSVTRASVRPPSLVVEASESSQLILDIFVKISTIVIVRQER